MIGPPQRWRERRDSYRPAGETIATHRYEVAALDSDVEAKAFVLAHHYSGTYPAARRRFGLHRGGALVGVAVFSHPCQDKVLTSVFDLPALSAVELGRFVLLDDVEANGETWFLARCFEQLKREGLRGVVSFSDPLARTNAAGVRIFPGHIRHDLPGAQRALPRPRHGAHAPRPTGRHGDERAGPPEDPVGGTRLAIRGRAARRRRRAAH